jgi:hypothetical protein
VLSSTHRWISDVIGGIGYGLYIPSEYLFLYSRLDLLSTSPRVLRFIRNMIILDFLLVELPCASLEVAANHSADPHILVRTSVFNRVEIVVYFLMNLMITTVYIIQVKRTWSPNGDRKLREKLVLLIVMSALILLMDSASVVIIYTQNISLVFAVPVRHYMMKNLFNSLD